MNEKCGSKRKGNHDNADYTKGTRSKLMGLLMYVGILPANSLALINLQERTVRRKAYYMEKEGALKKERLWPGEWAYRISKMPRDEVELIDLQDTFPILYERFRENYSKMVRRAKGWTWKGDPLRMVRNAETVMFMDLLPIAYLPEKKAPINETFAGNVFYTASELKEYEKPVNSSKTGYSRASGVMFTNGGTYVTYDYADNLIEFQNGQESSMRYLAMRASVMHGMNSEVSAIALYRSDELLQQLITREKYYASTQYVLDKLYKGVYALPLTREGQELAAYMCVAGWEEAIMETFGVVKDWGNSGMTDDQYYSDGEISVKENDEIKKKYVFVFGIPNIKRFTNFILHVNECDHPDRFAVRCFDFQYEVVKAVTGNKITIQQGHFELFKKSMKNKFDR